MPSKHATLKPSAKNISLGKHEAVVTISPAKDGICSWEVIIQEKKTGAKIASFKKGFAKKDYIVTIGGEDFPINNNGVQATYAEWKTAVEGIIKREITWQPQGREMFRYNLN